MGSTPTQTAGTATETTKVWKIFSLGAALLGATVAKKGMNQFWQKATGKNPPANPADPDVDVWEAVAWAAASGTFIALARMLATRRAASYYIRSTGKIPGDLRRDEQDADKAPAQKT
jgi:uncharacterized SAM-binding protein YcdF (DUF218 family)